MGYLSLATEVIIISSSGVLSPGPLTVATVITGTKRGKTAGLYVATGHMVVEIPLVVIIAYGIYSLMNNTALFLALGVTGIGILTFYGVMMIRDGLRGANSVRDSDNYNNPFLVGVLFSATNPHFIFWWVLVGSMFVVDAIRMGGAFGLFVAYMAHIWMDYAWLYVLTYAAAKGKNVLSSRGYRVFLGVMGAVIILFAILLAKSILGAID